MSSPPDVVKRFGRVQLMIAPWSSDAYDVVVVDAADPNGYLGVGSLAREASTLPDVVRLLRSELNSIRTGQEELERLIEAASDADEREHLEYHLRYHKWFSYQFATALQEIETSHAVKRDDEC
jgi:hypothetical protein